MVTKGLPVLNLYNPFHMTKKWIFGPGWIRWPLIIFGGYSYNRFTEPVVESIWQSRNDGHTQRDMWNDIEKRTLQRNE